MKFFNPYRNFVGSFIPNCLMSYKGLTGTAKLCWARLAQYAGKDGIAYPSQDSLAEELGISKSQVIRILSELEKKNFIKRIKATGQDKFSHKTNRYYFIFHPVFKENKLKNNNDTSVSDTSEGSIDDTWGGSVDDTSLYSTRKRIIEKEYIYTRFNEIWEKYPNKDGKKAAFRHFKASVNSDKNWKDINQALSNYLAHLETEKWKKPKNGSTWFNNWQDWIILPNKKKSYDSGDDW